MKTIDDDLKDSPHVDETSDTLIDGELEAETVNFSPDVLSEDEQAFLTEDISSFGRPVTKAAGTPTPRNAKRILAIVGILMGILVTFLVVYNLVTASAEREASVQSYRDEVLVDYEVLVADSKSIREAVEGLSSLENFPTLEQLLKREVTTLETMIARLATLEAPEQYLRWQGDYAAFLVRYRDYFSQVIPVLGVTDVSKVDDRVLSDLVSLGAELKVKAALLRSDADFIKSDIDGVVFTAMPANVRRLVVAQLETIVGEQIQAEVEKEQAQKAEEQLALERTQAEEAVNGFFTAYIAEDINEAKTYLALNVRDDYDLEQDVNDRITAYEVLSQTAQQGGGYSFIVRITHEKSVQSEVPLTTPVGEIETETITSNEEIRLSKQNEAFLLTFVEFLEP